MPYNLRMATQSPSPPGLPPVPPPLPPATMRRNYRLGVMNGVLFTLGETMLSANLVLALLIRQLGGSLALVGLLPALQSGGYLLPQMLVGGRLQGMRAKLPLYRRAAFARIVAYLVLLAAIFGATRFPPTISLWLIVVSFSIFNLGGGTSTLAFQDVVAKVIPARRRGSFFGTRQLFGGLLSFLIVGPLVRWLLNDDGPLAFPNNYGTLGVLGLLCIAAGLIAFGRIDEPLQAEVGAPVRMSDGLRRAPAILREHADYRWFIVSRMLTRFGQVAEPFYIVYATETLGLPASAAGLYLAVQRAHRRAFEPGVEPRERPQRKPAPGAAERLAAAGHATAGAGRAGRGRCSWAGQHGHARRAWAGVSGERRGERWQQYGREYLPARNRARG